MFKNMSYEEANNKIHVAVDKMGFGSDIADVVCRLNRYIDKKLGEGEGFVSSSMLYIALSELGYRPELCIGKVMGPTYGFDKAWVELEGHVIDLEINRSLVELFSISNPVVLDVDIGTGKLTSLSYGVTDLPLGKFVQKAFDVPFSVRMENPRHGEEGVWPSMVSF